MQNTRLYLGYLRTIGSIWTSPYISYRNLLTLFIPLFFAYYKTYVYISHLRYIVLEQFYKYDPYKPWAVEPYNYIEYTMYIYPIR